jgi:RNA recognition motif-containing protein
MVQTIFVSNLSPEVDEKEIRELFNQYGEIHSLDLVSHHKTGKSRGICFVEMNPDAANDAIKALNGKEFRGRNLQVRLVEEEDGKDTAQTE